MRNLKVVCLLFVLLTSIGVKAQFISAEIGIDGLTCSACTRSAEMSIRKLPFVADVKMNIELIPFNGELLPAKISYQGSWNVPFHKVERASFLISQKEYRK